MIRTSEIVKRGIRAWNVWRIRSFGIKNLSKANLQGANLQNVWRIRSFGIKNLSKANLQGANLQGANLQGMDLNRSSLQGANFQRASLQRINLERASLHGADLQLANLQGANLRGANLERANIQGANLHRADLERANLALTSLQGVNFQDARAGYTIFADIDLREVRGLESVIHVAPSTLGIDTLIASNGQIPEPFLRGCGVPDSWIENLPALIGSLEPIQFYSCFISYTENDEAFAKRLHERMQRENLRVWFAPEDLKGGHKLRDQLHSAIQLYDKFLLILSDASMASDWVADEVSHAYARERKEQRRILFPISLNNFDSLKHWKLDDDDTGRDLAKEIRRYYIPDFSTWKDNDAFEASFARLLNDLKANDAVLPKR